MVLAPFVVYLIFDADEFGTFSLTFAFSLNITNITCRAKRSRILFSRARPPEACYKKYAVQFELVFRPFIEVPV